MFKDYIIFLLPDISIIIGTKNALSVGSKKIWLDLHKMLNDWIMPQIMQLTRRKKKKKMRRFPLQTSPFGCFLLSFFSVVETSDLICLRVKDVSNSFCLRQLLNNRECQITWQRTDIQKHKCSSLMIGSLSNSFYNLKRFLFESIILLHVFVLHEFSRPLSCIF